MKQILKYKFLIGQLLILISFLGLWELAASLNIIDEFFFSKPSAIFKLLLHYLNTNQLFKHIFISVFETLLGIIIGSSFGILVAILLWSSKTLAKLLDPFMVVLNALPKTALAPIIIIWAGTGLTGIIVVSISILVVVTIISTYNYFIDVDPEKLKMMESFKANKIQVFTKLVFPSNLINIIGVVKINIGLAWVGVIVGEFQASRAGIGYLILYGSQVFRLDLVMMGVAILAVFAYIMYEIVNAIEKFLLKKRGKGI